MAAYVVGQIRVKDPAGWEEYRSRVGATIAQHGGEVVTRGKTARVFSGEKLGDAVVILRFRDLESATRWHDSAEYQAIVPLRNRGAEVTLTLYEA
jgi:uncharacterized protein (DUF1330 family)